MRRDQERSDRDEALRALLVDRVAAVARADSEPAQIGRDRLRLGIVTGVVVAVVVTLAVVALRMGAASTNEPAVSGLPTASTPAGVLLGRWTSADGPTQSHVIRPNGLALATMFVCKGPGAYTVRIPHDMDEAGTTRCDGSSSGSGNKGVAGSVTVHITTARAMRWTLTVVGIPETYVTPRPVLTPTTPSGVAVRFCTAADLSVRYQAIAEPKGVTEVRGGQLVFTNTSSSTCALAGYPMVRFLDGGVVLGHHTMDATDKRSTTEKGLLPVVVAPAKKAYSQIDYYLPNYYDENDEGRCAKHTVHALRIDLANHLAGAEQIGTLTAPTGPITACLNGPHGVDGKYGQLSSTVFVGYSAARGR